MLTRMKSDNFVFKIGPPSEARMLRSVCHPNAFNNETYGWSLNVDKSADGDDIDPETRSAPEQSSSPTKSQTAPNDQTPSPPVITSIEDQVRTDNLPPSTEPGSPQMLDQMELSQLEIVKLIEIDNQMGYINEDGIRVQSNPDDTIYIRSSKRKRPAPAEVSVGVSTEDNDQAEETSASAIIATPSSVCLGLSLYYYCG